MRTRQNPGIYVEILIRGPLHEVWRRTQDPALHQQWDLRFTEIRYLPRPAETDPQRFFYSTRIGFGLSIDGQGESLGRHDSDTGESTSALRFWSDEAISLIREGSGYWRYIPEAEGVRFLTWYDYDVRFGSAGKALDRIFFRPLMGWATAWSFDRLRLWIEQEIAPSTALALSAIHAIARCTIAFVWAWHGLVPKLIYRNFDEQKMIANAGLSLRLLPFLGWAEIIFAILMLVLWRSRRMFIVNFLLMSAALIAVAVQSSSYLTAAFNPVTLNVCMMALSVAGYMAAQWLPSATRCARTPGNGTV